MVVESVTLVVLATMGRCDACWLTGCKRSTSVSTLLVNPLSNSGQPSDYTEAMLKSFLTLADVMHRQAIMQHLCS